MRERDKCNINGKIDEYQILRNKISKLIDKAKKEMYRNKLEEGQADPRTIWKIFKHFCSLQKMESTESAFGIKINEQAITNEQMMADHFNEFFINIASNLKQPIKPSHFEKLNNFINSKVTDDVFLFSLIYP